MASMTDSEMGRVLLTLRGVQWILGTKGDPYALLLRAAEDNPHELGRKAREQGALYWSSAEAWVTADHELAAAALEDPRLTPRPLATTDMTGEGEPENLMPWDVPPLGEVLPLGELSVALDRTDYERLWRWAGPEVGEKAVRRHYEDAFHIYRSRIDGLGERFDLMADVARPAAVSFTCALLGLSPDRAARFAELHEQAAGALDATLCPPALTTARRLSVAISRITDLLTETIDSRNGASDDDLVSRLLGTPAADGTSADERDVLTICALLTLVGVEMAANLVCNAMAALLEHSDQWELLRDDPGLAPAAVEETLRYAPPVRLHRLYARQELELSGVRLVAGEELVVLVEAAGRDPRVHTDSDRFDIRRTPRARRLAAPDEGLHTCLVGPMIRMQAGAALQAIVTGAPRIGITDAVLRRLRSPITGGVLRFPVIRQ